MPRVSSEDTPEPVAPRFAAMPCAPKAVVNHAAYSAHSWRRDVWDGGGGISVADTISWRSMASSRRPTAPDSYGARTWCGGPLRDRIIRSYGLATVSLPTPRSHDPWGRVHPGHTGKL